MNNFDELCTKYGVRMHKGQKKKFREYLTHKAQEMGYSVKTEKSLIAKNIVVGDVDNAEIIYTAHYDTPPRLPRFFVKHMLLYCGLFFVLVGFLLLSVPQIVFNFTNSLNLTETVYKAIQISVLGSCGYIAMHTMGFLGNANKTNYNDNTSGCITLLKLMDKYQKLPQKQKDKIAFVFFDNEEKFLLGSFSFKHLHKKNYKDKTFVNLDCVGLGNQINLYHFGKKTQIANEFKKVLTENGKFVPRIKKSSMMSMSDHYPVRKANHVCLLAVDKNNNKSLYNQIHSSNDNKIDFNNLDNLVENISNLTIMKNIEHPVQISELSRDTEICAQNTIEIKKYNKLKSNEKKYDITYDKTNEM